MSLGKNKIIGVGMVLSGSVHEYDGFREPDRLVRNSSLPLPAGGGRGEGKWLA
jgi:hypothetical protein